MAMFSCEPGPGSEYIACFPIATPPFPPTLDFIASTPTATLFAALLPEAP